MLFAFLWAKSLVRKGDPATKLIMASDDKIAHSIICEHTRRVATHDNAKPAADRKRKQNDFSSELRIKEFNRSRRLLLANALRLRRKINSLPDDTNQ
jgi:hypothetical protein